MADAPTVHAVFLAAGFATRMYPLTHDQAKPLLEIGGEPLLTRLVRQVESSGLVRDAVVVTNGRFHTDFVRWRDALECGFALELVNDGAMEDAQKLGAIADLALALAAFRERADAYLVLAGDNFFDFDMQPMLRRALDSGNAQLLVRQMPEPVPPGRYSEVRMDAEGHLVSFREKPADPQSDLSAIAVYAFPAQLPELVQDYLASGGNPDAPGHLLAWLAGRVPIDCNRLEGKWFDVGSLEDLEAARRHTEPGSISQTSEPG